MMAALYMLKAKTLWYVPLLFFFSQNVNTGDSFCFDPCVCPQMDQQLIKFLSLLPGMLICCCTVKPLHTCVFKSLWVA